MKKSFLFGSTVALLSQSPCLADYIAHDFDHPETGKKTVLIVDKTKPKDSYVLLYDSVTKKFYYDKVEKNKPTPHATETAKKHSKSAPKAPKENSQPAPVAETNPN